MSDVLKQIRSRADQAVRESLEALEREYANVVVVETSWGWSVRDKPSGSQIIGFEVM